jgi:hypothetical protein
VVFRGRFDPMVDFQRIAQEIDHAFRRSDLVV